MTIKKMFEMLNRINHTPSESNSRQDSNIKHKEQTNAVLTSPNGEKRYVDIPRK